MIEINACDIRVGDVVEYENAKFKVHDKFVFNSGGREIHANYAKWVGGREIEGFFTRSMPDFNLQGDDKTKFTVINR